VKTQYTLVGLQIEGDWNVPLLENAAEMSGASLLLVDSRVKSAASGVQSDSLTSCPSPEVPGEGSPCSAGIEQALSPFDCVLACETGKNSRSIYDCAVPRGNVALIVGNERNGLPLGLLKQVREVVSVPMLGKGLTSVNVAAAAAIILYVAGHDFGRRRRRPVPLMQRDVDVLVFAPADPSEVGSLLRSAWAFGWQRVFLADPRGAWFSSDRATILAGRAAARSEVNRLVVRPKEELDFGDYDQIVVCGIDRRGDPLSKSRLRDRGRVLLVYGEPDESLPLRDSMQRIYVDHACAAAVPCFRHAGSIFLSVISQQLARGRRG
jgi:tRNA G18 (ribose-2'-O)-methylase SpoU